MNLDVNKLETPDFNEEAKELMDVNVKSVILNLVSDVGVKRSTALLDKSWKTDIRNWYPAISAKQWDSYFTFVFQNDNITMLIGDKVIPNELDVTRVNTKYSSLLNTIKYQSAQVKELSDFDANKALVIELLKDLIK